MPRHKSSRPFRLPKTGWLRLTGLRSRPKLRWRPLAMGTSESLRRKPIDDDRATAERAAPKADYLVLRNPENEGEQLPDLQLASRSAPTIRLVGVAQPHAELQRKQLSSRDTCHIGEWQQLCSAFMRFAQLRVRVTNMESPTRDRAVPNRPAVIDGSGRDCTARRPAARRPGRGDPDAAPATRLIRRTRREAAAHRSSYPCQTRTALAILKVARCPGGGAPRDDDPLAPRGLVAVLPPEVWTRPPCVPTQVQDLIRSMGSENPTGGKEWIAIELPPPPRAATTRLEPGSSNPSPVDRNQLPDRDERHDSHSSEFLGCSGCLEIAAPAASYAIGVYKNAKTQALLVAAARLPCDSIDSERSKPKIKTWGRVAAIDQPSRPPQKPPRSDSYLDWKLLETSAAALRA